MLIDGDVYYENKEHNRIYIWELAQLKSIDVIFGKSSTGGSQCFSGTNFVLSVQEQHPPRFDAIDGCAGLDHQIGDDSIRFWYDATPWYQGRSWIWTPKDGFGPFETVLYQPDLAKDWTYLQKQEDVDPSDLFYYPVIARQIYALIGNERSEILYSILGPGDGEFRGDYYVGKACQAHSCGNKSIIIADFRQKRVFIAWKSYKESVVTYPHLSNWPETYRRELADWEKELGKGDRWPSVAAELPAAAEPQAKAVPSFDCNRAMAGDEIAICSNSKLSEMDNLTAAGFAFVRLEHGKSEATRVGRPLLRARQACGSDTSCILRRQIEAVQVYQSLGAPIILPHWVGAR